MKDVLFYSLVCVLLVVDAVVEGHSLLFVPAIFFGLVALLSAYRSGKGQMLTEGELPKTTYEVVYEVTRHGHTVVAVRPDGGKILVCISDGVEFTKFKLWGDYHRVLTPLLKK
jgi:hypothetical protein